MKLLGVFLPEKGRLSVTQTLVQSKYKVTPHINHSYPPVYLQISNSKALNSVGEWNTNTLDKDLLQADFYLVNKYGK